ncbi:MAG: outer membrane beta-barrel protein [Fluviicola sp.]|nr:outer membrane beta-barrel protein [Fluviicola sp.]
MEDFTNNQNDSIPEGLEFNESYMTQAFEMYDAAKKSRKRRLFIWFWRSSLGFAAITGISIGIYFATRADEPTSQRIPETAKHSSHKQQVESTTSTYGKKILKQHETNQAQKALTASTTSSESTRATQANNNNNNNRNQNGSTFGSNSIGTPLIGQNSGATPPLSAGRFLMSLLNSSGSPLSNALTDPDRLADRTNSPDLADSADLSNRPNDSVPVITDSLTANEVPAAVDSAAFRNRFVNTSNHHIYMNLGVNTLFGISELKNSFNMRESFGLGYDYTINKLFFVSINAEYHSISKINYYRYIGENTKSSASSTYFTKTTLKYLSLDPKIGVTFGKRHSATLGMGFEYLIKDKDPKYEVKGYTNSVSSMPSDYYSTFNQFNVFASIGYGFRFSKNASLFATYHYGFSDITRNMGLENTFDRNSRLQLLLRVKLY